MISTSLSYSSVRSLASSQSITAFAQGLAGAPRLAEVANTAAAARNARRRVRADTIFPPVAPAAPVPASPPSSSSVSSMSSTKSFKSFAKDLAITHRLADLNVAGQQARTCRGRQPRARAATFGRSTIYLVPSSSSSLPPPLPVNASTVSFGRRALIDRPLIAKPVVATVPRRLFSGNAPEAFTKLSPEHQLAWREFLVGKPAEKPKGVQKLLQAFKRS